jgi:DNA-binding CsgD family transcriptional regulator
MSNLGETFSQSRLLLREMEMLFQVLRGHSNKIIAQDLGMTEAAVKLDLTALFSKIRVENRTQATIWALNNLPEALGIIRDGAPENPYSAGSLRYQSAHARLYSW